MPRESKKARIARMHQEYEQLCVEIPDPKCALNFNSPFELLVATVLSAQTTDKRVNMVTPELFGEYPGPAELAAANPEHVEDIIRTIGFFRTKARNIIGLSHELCVRFGGEVPADMASLVSLPGVGRKTANVVLGNAFGVPGFPVDTHVIRVTGRLRWRSDWASPSPDPVAIEREVTACFPPEESDRSVSPFDIAWPRHLPCAKTGLRRLPPQRHVSERVRRVIPTHASRRAGTPSNRTRPSGV